VRPPKEETYMARKLDKRKRAVHSCPWMCAPAIT